MALITPRALVPKSGSSFFSMKVRGLKQLDRKLKKLSEAVRGRALAAAADAASEPILKQMDARVTSPGKFGTGELRSDLRSVVTEIKSDSVTVSIGPGLRTAWRAHFIEFGTVNRRAFPFMRPALNVAANESIRIFKTRLKREIKRAS